MTSFFSILIKAFRNLEKLIRFLSASFHYIYKWRKFENAERNVSPKALVSSSANHGGQPSAPGMDVISSKKRNTNIHYAKVYHPTQNFPYF